MNKGLMIVFDGSNGAGKTTVIDAVVENLRSRGLEVVVTREPGGTPVGEKIREVVLSPATPEMCDTTELMLFAAARAQHVQEKLLPAINAGKVVISDRFSAATVSFQHYARGLSRELIDQLNTMALNGFSPDLNIILDLDPVVGLERVNSRGEGLDRMEDQKLDFLAKARFGYLEQAKDEPSKFTIVDAAQSQEDVLQEVLLIVDKLLEAH